MSKIGIFMADGCEEIEGLTVVDIVRRPKLHITKITVNAKTQLTTSHPITINPDPHPGFEEKLTGAATSEDAVVVDRNIITSRGMGTAIPFALEIVRYFADDAAVEHIKDGLVYHVVQ